MLDGAKIYYVKVQEKKNKTRKKKLALRNVSLTKHLQPLLGHLGV
jgi:hypothetical protein